MKNLFKNILKSGAKSIMNEADFIDKEIKQFTTSEKRSLMLAGSKYYEGYHDILKKQRTAIGKGGGNINVNNLPNNRINDNQYGKLVDQKVSYLLSKPIEVRTDDANYKDALNAIFSRSFMKKLKNVGTDALNGGVAYLYPYVENNTLKFKRFAPESIIPFWRDAEHEELDAFIRFYNVSAYEGNEEKTIKKVEYYTKEGIRYYVYDNNGRLIPDVERINTPYLTDGTNAYNWDSVPLIAFKYNHREIPLIARVKTLQDALNKLISSFADRLQEDTHSTVLVIENYDGQNLGELRQNLATYGAIKVRTQDGQKGGVSTLSIDVNCENYKVILKLLKSAITENGRGFDAKDDRFNNNPNQMNIRSMYADIDLDASLMETEFQSSLEKLLSFVNAFISFKNIKPGAVEFVFNKDLPQDELSVIQACQNSVGILSEETIVKNHPWTRDTKEEIERIKEERKQEEFAGYDFNHEHHE